jgi:hypothetical protein
MRLDCYDERLIGEMDQSKHPNHFTVRPFSSIESSVQQVTYIKYRHVNWPMANMEVSEFPCHLSLSTHGGPGLALWSHPKQMAQFGSNDT